MKKTILPFAASLLFIIGFITQAENDEQILEDLLHEFLQGASANNFEVHNRFWAEDLVYTSASGERISKDDIMSGLAVDENGNEDNLPVYSAEEIQIKLYGNTAIVAFRLIAEIPLDSGDWDVMEFYNTGTFLQRDDEWRVVAWQATRIL